MSGAINKLLKRSQLDSNVIPLQYFDEAVNDMIPVSKDNPLPINLGAGSVSVNIDNLDVSIPPNNRLIQGNITFTDTNAVQLAANETCKVVTIQAHPDNLDYVYLGNSSVSPTSHMYVLGPGSTTTFTVSNLNLIYACGTVGERISFGGEALDA